jgi:hypothetical protein
MPSVFLVIPLEHSRGEAKEIGVSGKGMGDTGFEPVTSTVCRKPRRNRTCRK